MNEINPEDNTGVDNTPKNDIPAGAGETTGYAKDEPNAVETTPPADSTANPTPRTDTDSTGGNIAGEIGKKLSTEGKSKDEGEGEGVAKPKDALPFDFSELNTGQLQTLKSMLQATPDKRSRTMKNPKARLRQVGENIIEDFQTAKNVLVDDPENNRKVFRHIIPVKYFGVEEYVNMSYTDFINAPQIELDVISERRAKEEIVIGTVMSAELGREIEALEIKTHKWFTVKLPNGETVELPSKMRNA